MSYSIKSAVNEVVLAYLESGAWLSGFGKPHIRMDTDDVKLIKWIIENCYIPESIIMNAVHEGICVCGRHSFKQHIQVKTPPDHTMSPKAFGYAIRYGAITKEEVEQIKFDHDETAEKYVKESEGLLEWVIEEFRKAPEKEWSQGGCLNCGAVK